MIHLRRSVPTIASMQVLEHRQIGEYVGDLERTAHAERGAPVLGQAGDVLAEQQHAA